MSEKSTRGPPGPVSSPTTRISRSNGQRVTTARLVIVPSLLRPPMPGRSSKRSSFITLGSPTCYSESVSWSPMQSGTVVFLRRASWSSPLRLAPQGSARGLIPRPFVCRAYRVAATGRSRWTRSGHHRCHRRPLGNVAVRGHGRLVRDRSLKRFGDLRAEEELDLDLFAIGLDTNVLDDRIEHQGRNRALPGLHPSRGDRDGHTERRPQRLGSVVDPHLDPVSAVEPEQLDCGLAHRQRQIGKSVHVSVVRASDTAVVRSTCNIDASAGTSTLTPGGSWLTV